MRCIFANPVETSNSIVLGIIVGVLALVRAFTPFKTVWLSWINVVAAIWLVISPFALSFSSSQARGDSIILGIIIGALALWDSITIETTASGGAGHAHA